nr:MAG TPA: Protein of unknown function (DUF3450) [Caudoviricetes sp.]
MKLNVLLLSSCLLLSVSSVVSAADITISQKDWTDFKQDLTQLRSNNKKQLATLEKQKQELTTLKKQLDESRVALTKAEESNNQLQKSLTESKKELKRLKPRTVVVSVGAVYLNDGVKPAINVGYHDVSITGNKDFIGLFYKLV